MEKIIVTTDQSVNSRSAIRFALNLAKVRKADLVVLNVYHNLKPFSWKEEEFEVYEQHFIAKIKAELNSLIKQIARYMDCSDVNFEVIMTNNLDVTDGIIQFIEKGRYSYLCISTRGAGLIARIFGTQTSQVIARSKIPVICVPSAYRRRKIRRVLYATDMNNYKSELLQLLDFVRPLGAQLSMVHIAEVDGQKVDGTYIEKSIRKKLNYKVSVFSRKWDASRAILQGIREEVLRNKPSAIVFFTHQSRSFLDKLLLSANAAELSFYSKIPIISFKK